MPKKQPQHRDDNQMDRFDETGTRRFKARDAVIAAAIIVVILVVTSGTSILRQGETMNAGIGRDIVTGVGHATAWIANRLPARTAAHDATAWLSPDPNLSGLPGFNEPIATGSTALIPPVTPDNFDPRSIGAAAPPRQRLHTVLVTGDSMSQPLDQYIAQTLTPDGVKVVQDPHLGTGISSTILVDWAQLAAYQVGRYHPDAVVIFLGANDGYSMPGPNGQQVNCCSVEWATIYAGRVRRIMNTFRQAGTARVYWLLLPAFREAARNAVALVINAAVRVAAEPWADQVRVIDTGSVFTPGGIYRDSMPIGGQPTIVRQSDGIHLNNAGAQLASKVVLGVADKDFTW